MSYLTELV